MSKPLGAMLSAKVDDTEKLPTPQTRKQGYRESGLTARALLLGLIFTGVCDLWIHWAELILSGRGHTALANTSIPIGAFNILFVLGVTNLLLNRFLRPLAFSSAELLVIYVMMTVSTVISSSGGIHFIVPTIAAAFYYADSSNGWGEQFHKYIPDWIAQKNALALKNFYVGNAHVPWALWRTQLVAWVGFMVLFSLATLCLVALLRKQWADRERLAFPTVAVPLELIRQNENLFRNRLLWFGFSISFFIDVINTLHLNYPAIPFFNTRSDGQFDVGQAITTSPWNAIGNTTVSFYPFVIGIAYLLSVEMTLSCCLFWLITKLEAVFGAATGISSGATGSGQSAWPFIGHQGAGAFLALSLVSLWMSRAYLREVWQIAFRKKEMGKKTDSEEPMSYRVALIGLGICLVLLVAWCMNAGMHGIVAVALIVLYLLYTLTAARIRAETGNAWLFGPNIDTYHLMTTTFGTQVYHPVDLTVLAYVRNAVASFDMRCLSIPNQFDAYKMADAIGVHKRRLTLALILAIVVGIAISCAIALMIWYGYGAGAKTDSWRTEMGKIPFDQLSGALRTPVKPDLTGTYAVVIGFGLTTALMLLRMRVTWWILHPVGYAMANTNTMNQVWLPFFIAWGMKVLVLRYGGLQLYRRSLPFCYGLIAGDFIAGGLTTLIGCLSGINVYATNW